MVDITKLSTINTRKFLKLRKSSQMRDNFFKFSPTVIENIVFFIISIFVNKIIFKIM